MLNRIMPTISIVVSLASLILATFAFSTAKSHFFLLNQAYLDAEPTIHLWTPDRGAHSMEHVSQLPKHIMTSGLNAGMTLKNVGNLPLKYKVIDFTVDIDGHRYENTKNADYTEGIIYPNQVKNFSATTMKFDILGKGAQLSYKELQQLAITEIIKVEYRNINATGDVKTWNRTLKVELFDGGVKYTWTSFDDKV